VAVPADRKYSKTHEWCKVEGNTVTVGITDFAANELTDITFVQLPQVGDTLTAGSEFGEIESVKATSPLYCAVSGKVVEVNDQLASQPELVNQDPYGAGWMIKVEAEDLAPLEQLMTAEQYEAYLASESQQ